MAPQVLNPNMQVNVTRRHTALVPNSTKGRGGEPRPPPFYSSRPQPLIFIGGAVPLLCDLDLRFRDESATSGSQQPPAASRSPRSPPQPALFTRETKQDCQTCNNSVKALASRATYLGAPAEHSGVRGRGVGGAPRGRGEEGQQQATRAHPHQLDARPASRRPPWQSPLQLLVRAGHDVTLSGGSSRGWRGRCCRGRGAGDSRGVGPPGPPPSTARAAGRSWSRTVPSTGGRGQRSTSTQSISVSGPRPPRPLPPLPDRPLEALAPPIAALLPESEQLAFPPSSVLRAEWAPAACPSRPIQPRPPFPASSRERRRPFYPPTFQA
ncbi:uncharacterized protein LOC135106220 [Scylla paramamosain]|uniref:uncharacterized protein LOC135106220 n=1 Tax=Scylla paramamosain TaxID=85552 RepID=UPI003082EE12